jgi:hypothetical protein
MGKNFTEFSEKTTGLVGTDFIIGYDQITSGGEKRYKLSTISSAVSSLITPSLSADAWLTATGTLCARSLANRFADVVNVKDFGAHSITEPGYGTFNSTTAIADALIAAAGKTLYFPAGTYLVSALKAAAAIFLPAAGITIRGAGKYSTTIKATTDCVLMAAVDANKIDIADIGFDGTQTTGLAWQRGVLLRGVVDASIRNCFFYRVGDASINLGKQGFGGSDAVPNGTRQCERIFIQDNEILDSFGTTSIITKYVGSIQTIITGNLIANSSPMGISVESEESTSTEFAEQIVVSNNIIYKCNYLNTATPVSQAGGIGVTERAKYVVVSNNVISNLQGNYGSKGIEVGTSPTQSDTPVSKIVISGNIISNVVTNNGAANGVLLLVGNESLTEITISANAISDCSSAGIEFSTAYDTKTLGTIKTCSITGNKISNTQYGLFFRKTGVYGDIPLESISIVGNVIKTTKSGIYLWVINSLISGNSIEGISATEDGIFFFTNSDNNTITGNNIRNYRDGMALNGNYLHITGNSCVNNTRNGIAITTGSFAVITNNNASDLQLIPTQQYGIRVPNGSTVRNNQILGNTGAPIYNGIVNQNTGTYDSGLNRIP